MEYPINGMFISKRGVAWHYTVQQDGTILQWRTPVRKVEGRLTIDKDLIIKPTQECLKIIKNNLKSH